MLVHGVLVLTCLQIPKDISPTEISAKAEGVDILCTLAFVLRAP